MSDNPTQPKFYNLYFANNTNKTQRLILEGSLTIPIMKKPSDYDVSIVRFVIPAYDIPLFFLPEQPTNGNPDLRFFMTMYYNGNYVSLPVIYDHSVGSETNFIWEIQAFIIMLNETIQRLYQSLNLIAPLPNTYTTVTPTFTTGTNIFTLASHGFANGQSIILQNSLGSLPAGVYSIINATMNTFQISYTLIPSTYVTSYTGSSNIFTLTNNGLLNGSVIQTTSNFGSLSAGNYFIINATTNTFQLSLTSGGSAVNPGVIGTATYTALNNTFTLVNHGLSNSFLIQTTSTIGSLIAGTYYVINATANTFQLSLTMGGNALNPGINGSVGIILYYAMTNITTVVTPVAGDTTGTINVSSIDLPYFTYNTTTQLISLTANKNYYLNSLTTPIYIGINESLQKLLQGLLFTVTNPINPPNTYWFVINNKNNNITGNYVFITQEALYFSNWIDFDSIVITTTMPIANEYQGSNIALPILSDFSPSDITINNFHNPIVYNPATPYRQYPLITESPFYDIKCYCYISSISGELRPIEVGPGQSANIKLMFTPKKTNKYA